MIRVSRLAILVFGALGVTLAANVGRLGGLVEIGNKVVGSFTGPLLGIYVLGIFTSRARSEGVLIGGLLGTLVTLYVAFLPKIHPISFMWLSTFGFLTTLVAGYGLSLLFAPAGVQASLNFRSVMATPEPAESSEEG